MARALRSNARMSKRIGFVVIAGVIVGCSASNDEQTEDGWAELSASPMAGVEALDTDVDESALDIADNVDQTLDLDDDELALTEDDMPDIPVENIESVACANPGPNPKYAKGAQLVTTEWLHLRTGPSIQHSILTTMKPGTAVAVLDPTCGHKWAHIKDSHGNVGYSAVEWLRPKQQNKPSGWSALYSSARGKDLASTSWKMWHTNKGHGLCLHGVRLAIDNSISPGFATGSPGASQFGDFARAHRGFMRNHHMTVYAKGESGAPSPAHFPIGTIMVFSKGRCGADPKWGHVEIVINSTVACSDHCRKRSDLSCGPDTIILPRK